MERPRSIGPHCWLLRKPAEAVNRISPGFQFRRIQFNTGRSQMVMVRSVAEVRR